ncbi:MAG TPA: hypothetical protein VK008_05860 [Sphingobacteriaceae bacterium]|nr:hypothetical protein [Sphingobacteriaceae bacterium]
MVLLIGKLIHFTLGAFVLAYGVDLTRLARLGLSPWDVLHEGIALNTPLSFGVASIFVGVVLVILSAFMGIRPRIGTVINMVVVGLMIDAILLWNLIPMPAAVSHALGVSPTGTRYGYLVGGSIVLGIGSAWYVTANLGAGPRDSLMLGLSRLTGWQVGIVRTMLEGTALLLGWLIGGPVGVGTIISALIIGWAIQGALAVFGRLALVPLFSGIIELPLKREPKQPGANDHAGE